MPPKIAILKSTAYFRPVEVISEGCQAFTHAALFMDGWKTVRYYVKSYMNLEKPLFNEIAGYLLADSTGLTQPSKAALISIPGKILDSIHPGQGFSSQRHWLCWATTAVTGKDGMNLPSAKIHFNGQTDAVAADIKKWNELPKLLAFDEWLANTDRNTGNLIRVAAEEYAIIDHGSILTGPEWISTFMAPIASYRNRIWEILGGKNGIPLNISSGSLHASDRFISCYKDSESELKALGSEILKKGDFSVCETFIKERAAAVKGYLQPRLGVVI